jgi:hypothetical protein
MLGMAGDPPVNFKYKIDKLADVRMINSQTWQQITLRAYATSVMCVLDDLKRAKGKDPNSESFVRDLIAEFPNMKLNFPVGRYTKPHEKTDAQFLFALI